MIFGYLSKKPLVTLAVIILMIVASIPLQTHIDKYRDNSQIISQTLYLDSSTVDKASLGYQELVAGIYWLRAIQYFGGHKVDKRKGADVLYNYFDIITDLDPKFFNAYRYGGTFLAEPYPIGFGDFAGGVRLLEKGRKLNPDNFYIPLEEAFLYYIYAKNYAKAAELFNDAADKPGLSDFRRATVKGMAGTALTKGNDRELAKQIWEEIYNTTQNEQRRDFALANLKDLRTRDMEDRLTSLVNKYEAKHGRIPDDLSGLLKKGYLKSIPADYFGGEFILLPGIKAVKSKTLLKSDLEHNLRVLNARSRSYKRAYGKYPATMGDLKSFIINQTITDYLENPYGEEYDLDPESGKITYDPGQLH